MLQPSGPPLPPRGRLGFFLAPLWWWVVGSPCFLKVLIAFPSLSYVSIFLFLCFPYGFLCFPYGFLCSSFVFQAFQKFSQLSKDS